MTLENLLKIGQLKPHQPGAAEVQRLFTLRHKRNLSDYTGEDIDHASVGVCIAEAESLLKDVEAWLKNHRPELTLHAKREKKQAGQ